MVVFENPASQVVITAVGPDNIGLADPLVHYVTEAKANICEIQMFNRDAETLFAMLLRTDWPLTRIGLDALRRDLRAIGEAKGLEIRAWPLIVTGRKARLALCMTYRQETPRAVLEAIRLGELDAEVSVMIGNRDHGSGLAREFQVDWHNVGDENGVPDDRRLLELLDEYDVDYVVLARYMRIIPEATCWSYAGGRIINLHHGLLPSYPGARPYADAFGHSMLTYGATAHFIIPELDAGNQIIHQESFSVEPGTPLPDIVRKGQVENEPACLVKALKRVVTGEVALHFHKVVRISNR